MVTDHVIEVEASAMLTFHTPHQRLGIVSQRRYSKTAAFPKVFGGVIARGKIYSRIAILVQLLFTLLISLSGADLKTQFSTECPLEGMGLALVITPSFLIVLLTMLKLGKSEL